MRWLACVATVWALVGVTADVAPGENPHACDVDLSFKNYPVSGLSRAALKDALLQSGPRDPYGVRRFAYTDWHITWKWGLEPSGAIDPRSIKVACSAVVTLPRLRPVRGMSLELISSWNSFLQRLRDHEMNHVRHAQERAGLIRQALRVAAQRHGQLTPAQAQIVAQRVTHDIRELDRRYDGVTNHGQREGAWDL